jgi:hypothetical protein
MNIPRWLWYIIWICIALVVLVVLKVNIQIGSSGIGITQGLVH